MEGEYRKIVKEIIDELVTLAVCHSDDTTPGGSPISGSISPISLGGPGDNSAMRSLINSDTPSGSDFESNHEDSSESNSQTDSGNDSGMKSEDMNGSYKETPVAPEEFATDYTMLPRRLFDPNKPNSYGGFDI